MRKIRFLLGFAAVVAFLASAAPAAAEFTSVEGTTKGKGEFVELNLEIGGATVHCSAFSEGASEVAWTITNGKEEVKKGSHLKFSTTSWGNCTAEASKLESSKATISGCELEVTETGEQFEVTGKDITTCTIKDGGCTITAEPKENESLTSFDVYPSGEEGDNLVLEPSVKDVADKVSAECEADGIKASKEGSLSGAVEMKQIQPQRVGTFWLTTTREYFTSTGNAGTVLITSATINEIKLGTLKFLPWPTGTFTANAMHMTYCENLVFKPAESCSINVTYNAPYQGGRADFLVAGPNNIGSIIILRGT